MPRALLSMLTCFMASGAWVGRAVAQECREAVVSFTPDCFRTDPAGACDPRRGKDRLDLGPQIAVWVTTAQGRFVDTAFITQAVGTRGVGNRPGRWDFRSGPKFPYGKRKNALPIWAAARGKTYDVLVMQDGRESGLGFHESVSSPDPYFCRPVSYAEVDVDAITCPTSVFNSAKGKLDPSQKTGYPPRNDLVRFPEQDCDEPGGRSGTCKKSSESFAQLNDLDAVSQATPPLARAHELRFRLPAAWASGEYAIMVEINKEYDQNAQHRYPEFKDPQLPESGVVGNIGQPSVLFRVPVRFGSEPSYASTEAMAGFGDWDGASGTVHPPDASISNTPGSGQGRLAITDTPFSSLPAGATPRRGRVHVLTTGCQSPQDCTPPPPPPLAVAGLAVSTVTDDAATVAFLHTAQEMEPVEAYEIRFREGPAMTEGDFDGAISAGQVSPSVPGTGASVALANLKGATDYTVGIRALGRCGTRSPLATVTFQTPRREFTQLSGCFIATASFGSALSSRVEPLRRARDQVLLRHPLGAAAVQLYYDAGPPLASAIKGNEAAAAAVRTALAPLIDLVEAAEGLGSAGGWATGR
jgi:hypothetical protein